MALRKLGLAGKSGSGKDLIADYLGLRYGYQKIAVADGIRDECAAFLEGVLSEAVPVDCHPTFRLVIDAFVAAVYAKPTTPEMRVLLQYWGTEFRRTQDPDYWIKQLSRRLDITDLIVVSDVRLPDEMAAVRKAGGLVWHVERPGVEHVGIAGHATEHGLDGAQFDQYVMNDGTIDDLKSQVDFLLTQS